MSHNTFDIIPNPLGQGFVAKSHNFPGVSGSGDSPATATEALTRALVYHLDNHPTALKLSLQNRKQLNRACLCGGGGKFKEALAVRTSSNSWERI